MLHVDIGLPLPDGVTLPFAEVAQLQGSCRIRRLRYDNFPEVARPASRKAFERIRGLALSLAPDAEQGTSYGMAALRYRRKPLLGFRAGQQHLSIFPFSPAAIDAVRDRLAGFDVSKGTVRFTAAKPLSDDVVRDLVQHRMDEIGA